MKTFIMLTKWALGTIALIALSTVTGQSQETTPLKLNDAQIASAAVTANQIDVNYGEIALKKSKNSDVKEFAQTMIRDHSGVIDQAMALAKKLGVTPQDNPLTQQLLQGEKETSKKLNTLKGKKFDKAYIDNEVAYHEAVIAAVKDVLIPQAQNAELKDLLVKVAPVLDHHLNMAKTMQAEFK